VKTGGGCWVCGSGSTRIYRSRSDDRPLTPRDFEITDSRYGLTLALCQCVDCGFVFAIDDDLRELDRLYEHLHDPEYEHTQGVRRLQMLRLLQQTLRLQPRARTLLDIGAGAGALVRQARALGIDATGVEPSVALVGGAERINGVRLLRGRFPHPAIAHRQFDIITIIDVIEHLSTPVELLCHAADALAPDGMIVVVTPDVGSVAARILKNRWWHFRMAHVGYFNRATILLAADRAGLRAVHIGRPTFYFTLEYLVNRLQRYMPIGTIDRIARKSPVGRWFYNLVIPVNPHDSLVVFLRHREQTSAKDAHA
jgi:SAM-dependent methyltransferase